jgi:hypothetical protein
MFTIDFGKFMNGDWVDISILKIFTITQKLPSQLKGKSGGWDTIFSIEIF